MNNDSGDPESREENDAERDVGGKRKGLKPDQTRRERLEVIDEKNKLSKRTKPLNEQKTFSRYTKKQICGTPWGP